MEEAEVRYQDLSKADYEFERDVVKGARIPRTKKVMAEKAQRFLEEKIKTKVSIFVAINSFCFHKQPIMLDLIHRPTYNFRALTKIIFN